MHIHKTLFATCLCAALISCGSSSSDDSSSGSGSGNIDASLAGIYINEDDKELTIIDADEGLMINQGIDWWEHYEATMSNGEADIRCTVASDPDEVGAEYTATYTQTGDTISITVEGHSLTATRIDDGSNSIDPNLVGIWESDADTLVMRILDNGAYYECDTDDNSDWLAGVLTMSSGTMTLTIAGSASPSMVGQSLGGDYVISGNTLIITAGGSDFSYTKQTSDFAMMPASNL